MIAAPKSPLQSLTITSAAVGLFVQLLALFGVQIAPELAAEIGIHLNNLIGVVAFALAIYGRWRASRPISTNPG